MLLHVPHGSRTIPPRVRSGLLLDDAALAREVDLITDAHTQEIAAARPVRPRCGPGSS